jgi:hypothetical protein
MSFLPNDYKAPKTSNYYMKLNEGENKFRILSQPILGWEDWDEKRPVRYRMDAKPLKSIDPKKPIRHFWSFIVWNYAEEHIQILHIVQASIRNSLEMLCKDSDWGDPYFYDIKIIKSGAGKDTEYTVNPLPHKPLNPAIKQSFIDRPCNLEALFDNADPFGPWETVTQGIFSKEEIVVEKPTVISEEQSKKLALALSMCKESYQDDVWIRLRKYNVSAIEQIPQNLYSIVLADAEKKAEEYQKELKANPVEWLTA